VLILTDAVIPYFPFSIRIVMLAMLNIGYSSHFPHLPGHFSSSLAVWSAISRTAYSFRVLFRKKVPKFPSLTRCFLSSHFISSPLSRSIPKGQMVHFHLESAVPSLSREGRGSPQHGGEVGMDYSNFFRYALRILCTIHPKNRLFPSFGSGNLFQPLRWNLI
jgi:hypothetical protein